MKNFPKIFFLIVLCTLTLIFAFNAIQEINKFSENCKYINDCNSQIEKMQNSDNPFKDVNIEILIQNKENTRKNIFVNVVEIIKYICIVLLFGFVILSIFCKTNFLNFVQYTYEQYKEMRQNKKAEKQKAMKEKLQKQLNELEKD